MKPGDRVVFYGDSITDQRFYTTLTEAFVITRYPDLNVSFIHSGWGGDKVSGGGGGPVDVRLQRDVLAYNPTVMTIMLGMNDGHYQQGTPENSQTFYTGYQHIVDTVRKAAPGIRITAIEPSPYDDVTRPPTMAGGYNSVLVGYSQWLAGYAKQNNLAIADFNTPMVEMLKKANSTDAANAAKILPDRVHPAISGHLVMAEQLLKAWNARAVVARVEIDSSASQPVVKATDHARVEDLKAGRGLSWTETDDALPLPFAEWTSGNAGNLMALAIASSDVTEALNQEPLKITGLQPGRYTLQIDGQAVGAFSDGDLAQGVNLAVLRTPMSEQAADVYTLTTQHALIRNDRWRSIQVPLAAYNLPEAKAAMDALDALNRVLIEKQRAAAHPKPHAFQLTPAT